MAGLNIHLAIGKKYAKKTRLIKNSDLFYKGIIAPDMANNKNISHYTRSLDRSNLITYLFGKVQLYEYLKNNDISSDYEKGVFLHLVTDYLFYNYFFDKEYIESTDYFTFNNHLYYSYDQTDEYLKTKYKLYFESLFQEMNTAKQKAREEKNTSYNLGKNILPINKLDKFIDYVSSIDLGKYKSKILLKKDNILP